MKVKFSKLSLKKLIKFKFVFLLFIFGIILIPVAYISYNQVVSLQQKAKILTSEKNINLEELQKISQELEKLKNEDQYIRNENLQKEIDNIQKTYSSAVSVYEDLLKLKEKKIDVKHLDQIFTDALVNLSKRDYQEADNKLLELAGEIDKEEQKIASSFQIPQNVVESNSPPNSGYSRQNVKTDAGTFMVSIVAADLGNTRVIVDTVADSDCANDCPVLPLSDYVSRNGAFAGVNGSYFCPATYPSCTDRKNTFDLLVMNYKKTYFNSSNNVYSTNPAVIFGDSYIRFVNSVSEWGRDTSPNGVLSNFPMLVFNKEIRFGGDEDPKKGSRGGRSFVANKGNTIYIGVVHSATVAEAARTMATLGMENAMNLDDGGSTALWYGGYKVGPGRNLPNVILFVRK